MDFSQLATQIGALIGVQGSTLVLLLGITVTLAKAIGRRIPDNSTGWLKTVRQVCSFIGVDVSNRLTPDATVTDVAKAALETPPIPAKVAANTAEAPVI